MSTSVITRSAVRANSPTVGPKPMIEATQSTAAVVMLWIFVVAPFVALVAAIPVAWAGAYRSWTSSWRSADT